MFSPSFQSQSLNFNFCVQCIYNLQSILTCNWPVAIILRIIIVIQAKRLEMGQLACGESTNYACNDVWMSA